MGVPVNTVPHLKAGGSFAGSLCRHESPVVESIQASAGIDIRDTLIGIHLRPVAVPVQISFTDQRCPPHWPEPDRNPPARTDGLRSALK